MRPNDHEIGVGPTEELSLRVSVAALVSVLFDSPDDGRAMLALERTATVREIKGRPEVTVRAKPFGGAVQLTDPQALRGMIGDFNYDSERSREEGDFRLQVRPACWEEVKRICRDHLQQKGTDILNPSPQRELQEEFDDTLHTRIVAEQYCVKPLGMVVEDAPSETNNVRAAGRPTVRFYYVFEAWMQAPEVIVMMLANSRRYSDKDLQKMAWVDAEQGGRGRANAVLTVPLDDVKDAYRSRSGPLRLGGHQFDGNVAAILNGGDERPYQRYVPRSR
jgi:hypothetical protein